jgi:hypothetical protein
VRERGEEGRREREREREIKFNTCITNTTPTKSAYRQTDSPLLDNDTSLVQYLVVHKDKLIFYSETSLF